MSPTYVPDLVHAALDLLLDGETGIWHLTNQGAISWHELAREAAAAAQARPSLIRLVRPAEDSEHVDTSLSSKRGLLLRPLDQAIGDFVASQRGAAVASLTVAQLPALMLSAVRG